MSTLRVNNITDTSGGSTNLTVPNTAKAWVNFNGTGTPAIRASFNVNTITDNGTGDYTVNFTNALSDANYAGMGGVQKNDGTNDGNQMIQVGGTTSNTQTASALPVITCRNNTLDFNDCQSITVAVFR